MFALEIAFKDGLSAPEVVFIRRLEALVGAADSSHVVVDDMAAFEYQLRLIRGIGRRFICQPVSAASDATLSDTGEGEYDGEFFIDTGLLTLRVVSLDPDLFLKESEPPDRAGVRVLRQAAGTKTPIFPAVVIRGDRPLCMSFTPDQPVYIGRAKHCVVRIDSPRVSSVHARLGFEGRQFWVEDLGSTNGTFVHGQPIAGRAALQPGEEVILAREVTLIGVNSEAQLEQAYRPGSKEILDTLSAREHEYPILLALSDVARPARLALSAGTSYTVGRDPGSDMWLGAPHVSRLHCAFEVSKNGRVTLIDQSTNGTAYDDGILQRGERLELYKDPKVLNFGAGLTVAICFSKEDEARYQSCQGAPDTFSNGQTPAKADLLEGAQTNILPQRSDSHTSGRLAFGLHNEGTAERRSILTFYESLNTSSRVLLLLTVGAVLFAAVVVISLFAGLF